MTDTTWKTNTGDNSYDSNANWSFLVPTGNDTAFFGTSNHTSLSITSGEEVGGWTFNPWADAYTFTIAFGQGIDFAGAGIVVNGGGVTIVDGGDLDFRNNSTAGSANIISNFETEFFDGSNAGSANINNNDAVKFHDDSSAAQSTITNNVLLEFEGSSTAGSALVHTLSSLFGTLFVENSTGGTAQFITDAGGKVDFSHSSGPAGDHRLTAGSIAGAGTYLLGANQLTVGSNGLSRTVSGAVDDGGDGGGSGASLVKVGIGKLTLSHAANTYSGGTTIEQGTLEIAAIGAAGPAPITFATVGKTKATLAIDNAALATHQFANPIDDFGKHDFLDLTGLRFHAGATATYHKANHHLTVHSGHVTDTLTLLAPHGTHFATASDHHGGTEVFLVFA